MRKPVLARALAIVCALIATPAKAERPVEHFARLPTIADPQISSDGHLVAARLAVDGTEQLAVFPIDGQGLVSKIALDGLELRSFFWVNDDWLVAEVGEVESLPGTYRMVTRLVSFNVKTRKLIRLGHRMSQGQNAADVLWIANDGTPRILLSQQTSSYSDDPGFFPYVAMVDVSRGAFSRVADPIRGVFKWVADTNGVVRIAVSKERNASEETYLYRATTGDAFSKVAVKGAALDVPVPVAVIGEPGKGIGFGNADGMSGLYRIDLASLAREEELFALPGYDVDVAILDRPGERVLGVRYVDTKLRTHWLDAEMAGYQTGLETALRRDVLIGATSAGRKRMVIHATSADRPTSYYVFNAATRELKPLGSENPDLGAEPLSPVRTISYRSRDGLDLQAILTLPKGREARNLPVIIMPHGGPAARDSENFDWWSQFLADRGYAVIQPNYRGSTGLGAKLRDAGQGEWGRKMQDDVDDALAWAASEGIVDPRRACIVGGSFGGYMAMRAAGRNPDLYRCAVSYAGVSDLDRMVRFSRQFYDGLAMRNYLLEGAPELAEVSPISTPEAVGIPILLVHGKRDLRVPVAQSREFADALRGVGKEVTYIEQPLGDHHFSRQEDRLQFLQTMESFLDKNNPA